MYMVRHAVNLNYFMPVFLKYTRNKLVKVFFPGFLNKCFSVFYSKDKLNVDLCVGVWHRIDF